MIGKPAAADDMDSSHTPTLVAPRPLALQPARRVGRSSGQPRGRHSARRRVLRVERRDRSFAESFNADSSARAPHVRHIEHAAAPRGQEAIRHDEAVTRPLVLRETATRGRDLTPAQSLPGSRAPRGR